MLKYLFFIVIFFFLVRYINRLFLPSKKRNSQFNPFNYKPGNRGKDFDEIEEAEYEDLSNNEK